MSYHDNDSPQSPNDHDGTVPRKVRYAQVVSLLEEWSREPGDYDERALAYLDRNLRPGELEFLPPSEST